MVVTRPADPGDAAFLAAMVVAAVNWDPRRPPLPAARVLTTPETARYVDGWGRPGDLGLVAETGGRPLGAAWLRLFPADAPGYGFVAEDVPELSIGVVEDWRGRGVGTRLLDDLLAEARRSGVREVSLSVARANPARRLYARHRFVEAGGDAASVTMRRSL